MIIFLLLRCVLATWEVKMNIPTSTSFLAVKLTKLMLKTGKNYKMIWNFKFARSSFKSVYRTFSSTYFTERTFMIIWIALSNLNNFMRILMTHIRFFNAFYFLVFILFSFSNVLIERIGSTQFYPRIFNAPCFSC